MMRDTEVAAADTLTARFARDGLRRCRRGARVFCGFAAVMILISALYSGFVEPDLFAQLLRIRALALVGIAIVVWLLATPLGARRPRELTLLLMLVLSLTLHGLAQATGGQHSPQYDRMSVVILASAILLSWDARWSLLGSATVAGTFTLGSALAGDLGTTPYFANLGYLLVAALVTLGGNVARERNRWHSLAQAQALAEARDRAEAEIRRLNEQLEQRVQERTAELRASEERFRAMFEAAPIGVVTVGADDRVLQCNRAFADMLGVERTELAGRSIEELTAPEDRGRSQRAFAALREGRSDGFRMHKQYLRADGTPVVAHLATAAIRDQSGGFLYGLGMVEDVSERVQAQARAREHQAQLAHVLRVTTMSGMVAELAHELNQPLGAIVNFANGTTTRLRQSGADPAVVESVERIASEGLRAAEILRRVREFVRPGGHDREPIDVNALVRESVLLVEPEARDDGIPVRLELDAALPTATLDRIQIEQVLLNLLRNAVEAMRAAPPGPHALVVRTARQADDLIEISVRDSGIGVSGAAADHIFDAFFTTKAGGLGMGLSISRSIVEAYGGRLWARANADAGMTFGVLLPTGDAGAGDAPPDDPRAVTRHARG